MLDTNLIIVKKHRLLIVGFWMSVFLVVHFISQAQDHSPNHLTIDIEHLVVDPERYVACKVDEAIYIDGRATEAAWQQIPFTQDFIDIEGVRIPELNTRCKMLWDEEFFYVYAEMEEPHVAANITKHDTVIFYDKDFEVFIDPSDDTYNYMELEINALNTTWDLYLDRPYRVGGRPLNAFEFIELKHAIYVDGTLNDAGDRDVKWTVELAIPMHVIMQVGKRGKKSVENGDYWRVNYSRVHWQQDFVDGIYKRKRDDQGNLLKEDNWVWSNQKAVNMHQPEFWGYVFFTDNSPLDSPQAIPEYPDDHEDKQLAYALFRSTRTKTWKFLRKKPIGFKKDIVLPLWRNVRYQAEFRKTAAGFEIELLNTKTNTKYIIDQLAGFKKI